MALAREGIPWRQLYQEGLRVSLGTDELPEASLFVVPFDDRRECIVILVPTPRQIVGRVREALLAAANMVRGGRGIWGLLSTFAGPVTARGGGGRR